MIDSGSIFDAIEEPKTGSIFDVAEKVEHLVPDEYHDEEIPWYKSYTSALGKGLIKGTISLGRMMGPLQEPYDPEETSRILDELLPSKSGPIEGTLERAGEMFPMVSTGGGGALKSAVRTGLSAISGETAKQLGASEGIQTLAELPALLGPELTKMIKAGKSSKELVDFARKKGMKEEEIAPLIQSVKKQAALKKIALKRGEGEKILSRSKEAIGNIYKDLYSHPKAKTVLSKVESDKLMGALEKRLEKMPSKVRNTIAEDLTDLSSSPKAAEDFMNFYSDINANLSGKTKQLSSLKEPIIDAISSVDKGLASEFKMTNNLYKNWSEISKTLKPSLSSDLFEGSMPIRFVIGLTTGYTPILMEVLGEGVGKKLATNLLLKPKFQGLGKKMVTAINENKLPAAKKIWDKMTNEVNSVDKVAAEQMRDVDILTLLEDNET